LLRCRIGEIGYWLPTAVPPASMVKLLRSFLWRVWVK
jgi:hypothetical protein